MSSDGPASEKSAGEADEAISKKRRLAIIGGGSSGLICLKYALDFLPNWEIVCFEKSDRITGCWGNPYPGFVSTSTKYTTQFSCFPMFDASVKADGGESRSEFFRDGEYGEYLDAFAKRFSLDDHIVKQCCVERIRPDTDRTDETKSVGWELSITRRNADAGIENKTEHFDQVVICTGLSAEPVPIECDVKTISISELNHPNGLGHVTNKRIVVVGGGESAVDYANRLSNAKLNNEVFLSLKSGIRVSPRYHPIRGVPSDFLRNRLMLSIHEDIRNWIGQRFVELRIRYQETFERLFPDRTKQKLKRTAKSSLNGSPNAEQREQNTRRIQKEWAYKLTKAAKDDLFNMFHNKSDDFLEAVGQGRIKIVGPPTDRSFLAFRRFHSKREELVEPDLVVPAVGYRADLQTMSEGQIKLTEFYQGCCHVFHHDLYLIGFARPIIGNIPSISEVQAEYVCGLIAGKFPRPDRIQQQHHADLAYRKMRYKHLNQDAVYPVEMFPYCDQLARNMDEFPSRRDCGSLSSWWHLQLTPATTMHYLRDNASMSEQCKSAPIYMPRLLVLFLLGLKPLDFVYRLLQNVRNR